MGVEKKRVAVKGRVKKKGAGVAGEGRGVVAGRGSGGARVSEDARVSGGGRKVVSAVGDEVDGAEGVKAAPEPGRGAVCEVVADTQRPGEGGGEPEGDSGGAAAAARENGNAAAAALDNGGSPAESAAGDGGRPGAGDDRGVDAARTGRREKVERRHRAEFEWMLTRHVDNSLWLRSRAPLLMALSDLAMFEDSSDSVRFRAMEKVEELLEKAEDEKRRDTTGNVSEGLEASVRRLESALRRGARDRDY